MPERTDTERRKYIDPRVRICSISNLRHFNEVKFRGIGEEVYVITSGEPLGVLMSYETFMRMQQAAMEEGDATN